MSGGSYTLRVDHLSRSILVIPLGVILVPQNYIVIEFNIISFIFWYFTFWCLGEHSLNAPRDTTYNIYTTRITPPPPLPAPQYPILTLSTTVHSEIYTLPRGRATSWNLTATFIGRRSTMTPYSALQSARRGWWNTAILHCYFLRNVAQFTHDCIGENDLRLPPNCQRNALAVAPLNVKIPLNVESLAKCKSTLNVKTLLSIPSTNCSGGSSQP